MSRLKDLDIIVLHLYKLGHHHQDQSDKEPKSERKAFLAGTAQGLLLAIEVLQAAYDIQFKFVDPYLEEHGENEDT